MRQLVSRLSRPLDTLVSTIFAGLLWTFASIPVITLFASTAALNSLIAERRKDNESPTFRLFKDAFTKHFKQATALEAVWLIAALLIWSNIMFATHADVSMALRVPAAAIGGLATVIATGSAAFLFKLLIDHPAPYRVQLRNAVLLALANIGTTLLTAALLAAAVLASYLMAPLLPVLGYLVVRLQYPLCSRAVDRTLIRAEKNNESVGDAEKSDQPEGGITPTPAAATH